MVCAYERDQQLRQFREGLRVLQQSTTGIGLQTGEGNQQFAAGRDQEKRLLVQSPEWHHNHCPASSDSRSVRGLCGQLRDIRLLITAKTSFTTACLR